ncbi:MAG: H-NS histone family protein [Rhodocyclaceae bacterium]
MSDLSTIEAELQRYEQLKRDAEEARQHAIRAMRELMLKYNITIEQVAQPAHNKRRRRHNRPARYRFPDGSTWTGRGRLPKWAAAAKARGEDLTKYQVEEAE